MRRACILGVLGLYLPWGALDCQPAEPKPEQYHSFRPGELWNDTDGKPIEAHGGGKADQIRQRDKPRHQCRTCGRTEKTDPELSFRYCSKCAGSCCYCEEHLRDHEHVTADRERENAER